MGMDINEKDVYIRILNVNVNSQEKFIYGMKKIKGIGLRFSTILQKKLNLSNVSKISELDIDILETLNDQMIKPEEKGFPVWIMNRIKDYRSFENGRVISSVLEEYIREDIDRLVKTKSNRGERHFRGL